MGVDEADEIGVVPNKSAIQLMAEGAKNALADAGLAKEDVDAIFCAGQSPALLGEWLGIHPRYVDGTSVGGCSFLMHVEHAAAAINAGLIEVAIVCHGESGRSRVGAGGFPFAAGSSPAAQFETPYGTFGPVTTFSVPVLRHFHEYGTTSEHLAEIAVATRKWAALNPKAMMRDPITIEDVLNSRIICYPLHLLDCCLVTDAGAGVVVTTLERAKDLPQHPVRLLGSGEGTEHAMVSMMEDFTSSKAAVTSGKAAFQMAGVSHEDIDVVNLYDAFTSTVLYAIEDLGFCEKGAGGPFVAGQRTAPGGDFPMNTNGGGLSYTHSGMYGIHTVIEIVRQLRHAFEGTPRQVPEARIGLAHGPGGMFSAASTLIMARD